MGNDMKRKNKIIAGALVLVLIAGCIPFFGKGEEAGAELLTDTRGALIAAAPDTSATTESGEAQEDNLRGKYTSAQERLADMELAAEDTGLKLYVDKRYAEVAVVDKASGESWFSNPYDFALDTKSSSDIKNMLQSIVRLTYYDSTATERVMNSWVDCVQKQQFAVENITNGVAIHMQIGRVQTGTILPDAAEATRFEEKVVAELSSSDARKINAYYKKVSLSDPKLSDAVKESYLKEYPGLKEYDFYILRTDTKDREKRILEEIIRKTSYTQEDYEEDTRICGYVSDETISALFTMTLEFVLDNGDLCVTIPENSVSYDEKEFMLTKFIFLEFFGCGKTENGGYLMIPDGSGALINYNTGLAKTTLYTTNTVYGTDFSFNPDTAYNSLKEQIYFPVYGNKDGDKAMFAIIEQGDAMATIVSESGSITSGYETVYPEFIYHPGNTINYTDTTKIKGLHTYFANKPYSGSYCVRYRFLTGKDADYVGMANSYRSYLLEHGALEKLSAEQADAKFYLETLGAIEKKKTRLGFPYTASVPLTTFAQAQEILQELSMQGLDSIALRYKGWQNGGLNFSVSKRMDIESSLGGKNGLKKLEQFAGENGMELFPDVDFNTVRKDGMMDGYSMSKNAAQSIAKERVWLANREELSAIGFWQWLFYSVSPYDIGNYMKSWFKDYNKLSLPGVSIGNLGNMLYSEYKKSKDMDRQAAAKQMAENAKTYVDGKKLMLDGVNAYMLPYVTDVVNLPLTSSSHTLEDESIPFMQLVLHGYVLYAGSAMNFASDITDMFLKSIEYGSNLMFTVAYDNIEELKSTIYVYCFSIDYEAWKQQMADYGTEFAAVYDGLMNLEMVSHEKMADGVYQTQYEGGASFIVNYNETEAAVGNVTVPARGYIKLASPAEMEGGEQ